MMDKNFNEKREIEINFSQVTPLVTTHLRQELWRRKGPVTKGRLVLRRWGRVQHPACSCQHRDEEDVRVRGVKLPAYHAHELMFSKTEE